MLVRCVENMPCSYVVMCFKESCPVGQCSEKNLPGCVLQCGNQSLCSSAERVVLCSHHSHLLVVALPSRALQQDELHAGALQCGELPRDAVRCGGLP